MTKANKTAQASPSPAMTATGSSSSRTMVASSSHHLIKLKNVNVDKLNATYGISVPTAMIDQFTIPETISPVPSTAAKQVVATTGISPGVTIATTGAPSSGVGSSARNIKTTKLSELNNGGKGTTDAISFLDESKKAHVCTVSMIDFQSKKNVNFMRYHCFWDRNPFDSAPIGCPIRYVPAQIAKTYYSVISRDEYTIKESLGSTDELVGKPLGKEFSVQGDEHGGYYETDGVFCSFNCIKAYILENKAHNNLYRYSEMLLMRMIRDVMGTATDVNLAPAAHWRMLEQYGGNLNILKLRENFNKIDYEHHGKIRLRFLSIGDLYEEKIKF